VALGAFIAAGPHLPGGVALALLGGLLVITIGLAGQSCISSIAEDDSPRYLGSLVVALSMFFTVLVPGLFRYFGQTHSSLERFGIVATHSDRELRWAILLSLAAFASFAFGDQLGSRLGKVRVRTSRSLDPKHALSIYWALIAVWAVKVLLTGTNTTTEAIVTRGSHTGEGIAVLLGWALPLAVAFAIAERHFGSRWLVGLNLALVAFALLPSAVRSPLLLIACACLARVLLYVARRKKPVRTMAALAVAAYIAASLFSGLSVYRGELREGQPASIVTAVVGQLETPSLTEQVTGLNTLDGLLLVHRVDPRVVDANAFDPAKAVLGFIPSQVWANKPNWLSVNIAHDYLGWKVGGIFYSGQGWAYLVFGGIFGVIIWFTGLGAVAGASLRRMSICSMPSILWTYFLVRFVASGDSFNMFHVLGLAVLFYAASWVTSLGRGNSRVRLEAAEF
jgi:hypothetical protein